MVAAVAGCQQAAARLSRCTVVAHERTDSLYRNCTHVEGDQPIISDQHAGEAQCLYPAKHRPQGYATEIHPAECARPQTYFETDLCGFAPLP
jgi:hypothetical protein